MPYRRRNNRRRKLRIPLRRRGTRLRFTSMDADLNRVAPIARSIRQSLNTHYYSRQYIWPLSGNPMGTASSIGQVNTAPVTNLPIAGEMAGTIYAREASQSINFGFKLSDNPDFASIAQLYDSAKVLSATLIFEPCYTVRDSFVNNTGFFSPMTNNYIRIVKDFDDQFTFITNESSALDYDTCRSIPTVSRKTIRMKIYPRMVGVVENADTTGTYRNYVMSPKWEDTAYAISCTTIGFKMYIPEYPADCFNGVDSIPLYKIRVRLNFVATAGK